MPNSGAPVEEQIADLRGLIDRVLNHTDTNRRQREESIANVLKGIETKLAEVAVKAEAKGGSPVPAWMQIVAALLALVVSGAIITGYIKSWGANDQALNGRITEAHARISAVETAMNTAGRIRDQQIEALRDGQRQLQQADMAGNERLGTVLTELATIRALGQSQAQRTEELIRRQDRLESRLGARPGAGQPPEQPTTYPHAL